MGRHSGMMKELFSQVAYSPRGIGGPRINFHIQRQKIKVYMHKSMHEYVQACLSVCMSVYLSVCLSVCTSVCLSVCMYVCIDNLLSLSNVQI